MSRRSRSSHSDFEAYGAYSFAHRGLSLWHLIPWLWPWALAAAVWPLGAGLHMLWGRSLTSAPWAAVLLALATVGLTALAYRAGQARGPLIRAGAAAAVASGGVWLLWALIVPPWQHPVLDVWIALALAGPISANLMRALRGDGQDGSSGWDRLAEQVKLPGARALNAKRNGHAVTAVIQAGPGQTQDDVQAAVPLLAAAFGAPRAGARAIPDPDNSSRATVTLVTTDVLGKVLPWPGLRPGLSIMDPIVCGIRESGAPLNLWLPADARAGRVAQHVLIAGMMGSGKSVLGRLVDAGLLDRPEVELWLIDEVKGRQYAGPLGDRVHRLARTANEARSMIASLPALIAQRADELGARGMDDWMPGCGMPYLVVHIEEAEVSISTSRPYVRAAQTGRSAGVSLITSLQRPVHTNLPVDARQQMGAVFQFGCKKGDARWGLSESTCAAGADPEVWGNARPGMVYAEVPGAPMDEWSAPARVFFAEGMQIAAALDRSEPRIGAPDPTETLLLPEPEYTSAEARQLLLSALRTLHGAGRVVVRPRDLSDVLAAVRRSPAWLTGELGRLVDDGMLVPRERGVYAWGPAFSALSGVGVAP